MSQQNSIPNSQFTERDADSLIRHFGVKPPEKTREKLTTYLSGQKEKFMEFERNRSRKASHEPNRSQ